MSDQEGQREQETSQQQIEAIKSGKKSNAKVLEEKHKKALEKEDDGFDELLNNIQEQIEIANNKLKGGNSDIRRPKQPLKVFFRFHMEEFNQVKMKRQDWTSTQITQSLKKRWNGMSEAQKDRYIQSYDQDMEKYDRLMAQFERLTQKPKKPATPFFQFFSENLSIYKKNYPQLSHNEITKLIGKDWNNFDTRKKNEMRTEYERQQGIYLKQIKSFEEKANDYVRFNDYMSKLDEYEHDLEEELDSLRSKYPKAPTSSEIKKHQRSLEEAEAKSKKEELQMREKKEEKLNSKTEKKQDDISKHEVLKKQEDASKNKKEQVSKNANSPPAHKKLAVKGNDSEDGKHIIDIEADLKEARNNNRRGTQVQAERKNSQEPQLRKQIKANTTEASDNAAVNANKSTHSNKAIQPQRFEKKEDLLTKSIERKHGDDSKKKDVNQEKGITKPGVKEERIVEERITRTRSQSKKENKPMLVQSKRKSSSSVNSVRSSSRLNPKKQVKDLSSQKKKQITKISDSDNPTNNIRVLKRKGKQVLNQTKDSKSEVSVSRERSISDDIKEVQDTNQRRTMNAARTNSNSDPEDSVTIKYMLGMRNGKETEYLVHFKDEAQRWTREDDPIFKKRNNLKRLKFFLTQIKEKQQ